MEFSTNIHLFSILLFIIFQICNYCCKGDVITEIHSVITGHPSYKLAGLHYGSYYKGPVCIPSEPIRHPYSYSQVIHIVREAISKGTTVKAIGHLHSATDVICTSGIPIDMHGINHLKMNKDGTVSVGCGAKLFDVTRFLRSHGRALKLIPAYGNITIGGAIGTGSHGTTIKHKSSLSEQTISVLIVDGYGELRHISDPDEMKAFRVHLGLLGILLEVTLKTVPIYKLMAHNYVTSDLPIYTGEIIKTARQADSLVLYWFPGFDKMVVANWTIVGADSPGFARTNDHVPSTTLVTNFVTKSAGEIAQVLDSPRLMNSIQAIDFTSLFYYTPNCLPIYTEDGTTVKNPAVGFYDDMTAPICQTSGKFQCPWFHGPDNNLTWIDNEVSIHLKDLPAFALVLKDIISKYPTFFPVQGVLLRFSDSSSGLMSISEGRQTVHVEFYMATRTNPYDTASLGLAGYQTIMQTLVKQFKGRSHWGKSGLIYHSLENIQRRVDPENLTKFFTVMKKYDPNGVFMNDFGRRLQGISRKINFDPHIKHCALLDNCICSKNTDCAPGQSCSTLPGYPHFPSCISQMHILRSIDPYPYYPETDFVQCLSAFIGGIV